VLKTTLAVLSCTAFFACARNYDTFAYVGGWDWETNTYPFRAYALDRRSGQLKALGDIDVGRNPSTSVPSADGRFLYIGHEAYAAPHDGISVAAVDRSSGRLTPLSHSAFASDISFVSLDSQGRHVLAASYRAGRVAAFPIGPDGVTREASDTIDFAPLPGQDSAQTHAIRMHRSGRLYIAHKGLDKITVAGFDADAGKFLPNAPGEIATAYAQPRHLDFSPDGALLFVSFESASIVAVYAIGQDGGLREVSALSTLPADFSETNTCSHILVHPNGRHVYVANRGHDSVAVFAVGRRGQLRLVQHQLMDEPQPADHVTPWHFDIDSLGQLLVLVNHGDQQTQRPPGSLETFSIGLDGRLTKLGETVHGLRSPISVRLISHLEKARSRPL
jgi:6-phosphogluconolactonase